MQSRHAQVRSLPRQHHPQIIYIKMNMIAHIIGDYEKFLDTVYANAHKTRVDVSGFYVDHIAYRTTSTKNYETLKDHLLIYGNILSEKLIRDRQVAIIELHKPLQYKDIQIRFVEILAPAKDNTFREGLEHAEFVINIPLSNMMQKYPLLSFIHKDKKINAELVLKFPNNANIKFHEKPIDEVISIEKDLSL